MKGLARVAAKAGDTATARQRFTELAQMPGAAATSPAVTEAQQALKATSF